jgi:hypothetical protein
MHKRFESLRKLNITVEPAHMALLNSASGDERANYSKMIREAIEKTYSSDSNKKVD